MAVQSIQKRVFCAWRKESSAACGRNGVCYGGYGGLECVDESTSRR